MTRLFQNDYLTLDVEPALGQQLATPILRCTHAARDYPRPEDCALAFEKVAAVIDGLGRHRYALLVDMRLSPMRNDPAYEQALAQARSRLLHGFRRVAVVVRTAAGLLQAKRHRRDDASDVEIFHEEAAALEYLRGP
jgi:hypothetical protein